MNESYIPYGYGARICLGKAFVVVQMELVIACLRIEYCIKVDAISRTIEGFMKQAGTLDTVPSGLRCDLYSFHTKHCSYWERSPWVTLRDTAEP